MTPYQLQCLAKEHARVNKRGERASPRAGTSEGTSWASFAALARKRG